MPTRRIGDAPAATTCLDREHLPPSMYVYPDGVYEHTCPSCGHVTRFTITNPRCTTGSGIVDTVVVPINNAVPCPACGTPGAHMCVGDRNQHGGPRAYIGVTSGYVRRSAE